MTTAARVLEFKDAGVLLGGRWIWRHVNLDAGPGEFIAVLGPNGAGKSTLVKAVLGLQSLAEGSVDVLDRPAARGNAAIGYLPQRRSFDSELRIRGRDLIRLGLDGPHWGVPIGRNRSAIRGRIEEMAELVGARGYLDRPVGELSGGEQQRLLIAQALISKPAMLLLDEPLDSLDISNQQAISSLVKQVCQEQRVAVLLVAHDVNPILGYLDKVIYVAAGQAVAGKPSEVITTATLSELYGTRIEVLTTTDGRVVVVGQPEAATFHSHN